MAGIKGYVAVIGEAFRNLFRPNVTVLFPAEHVELPDGFRGAPEVVPENCTVCRICEKECPTHCITIEGPIEDPNTPEGKEAYTHSIKLAQCMFCQTCEEFCRFDAIHLTKRWLLSAYDPDDTIETKVVYRKAKKKKE
ncbi:MAG: 4Fe-4S dicluster domain-containing protein [Candidatus Hodarchaeales archaeon]